jgi:hypothetical protein
MSDIKMTPEGEVVLNDRGDLDLATGDEWIVQEVVFRLKTSKGDWVLKPGVGADLETFIGRANRDETLAEIEQAILDELTKSPHIKVQSVQAAPLSENTVTVVIELQSIEQPARTVLVAAELDLKVGEVYARSNLK